MSELIKAESGQVSAADYFAAPGLSCSGLKDLAISPLRYWHRRINPNRPPDEPTPEMLVGSAVHCAVLEPGVFLARYDYEVSSADFPGCLVTMPDLAAWLKERGLPHTAKCKNDLIARVLTADPEAPVFDRLVEDFRRESEGKVIFRKDDWDRINDAAEALRNEPRLAEIMAEGQAEVSYFVTDPETGVLLKARMDWVSPRYTVDIKTFSQQRGKPIDRCVTDAIYYERYHWQAWLYSHVRAIAEGDTRKSGAQTAPTFVNAFVESDPPHETRLRSILPRCNGEVNLLWERARLDVTELIRTYARCLDVYGDKPWRAARQIDPVVDGEIKALAFG